MHLSARISRSSRHTRFYLSSDDIDDDDDLPSVRQEFLPDLYRHFQAENFRTSMYASSWFLTLFTTQFSLAVVDRIMDLFLSEVDYSIDRERKRNSRLSSSFNVIRRLAKGMEMIFRISLALLELHQDELMLLSMEDMLKVIPF